MAEENNSNKDNQLPNNVGNETPNEDNIEQAKLSAFDVFMKDLIILTKDKRKFIITTLIVIAGLSSLLYYSVLDNSKHFDDDFIFTNPGFQNPKDYLTIFKINAFRFIPFYTFAQQLSISGNHLSQYYVVNIAIHIINSFLVFLLAYSLLGSPKLSGSKVSEYRAILSMFLAIIFAVHPIQTQAVSYIYQRLALIGAFFYFSSIYFYVSYRMSEQKFKFKFWLLLLSIVSIVGGLFSKENTFTLPGIFVLLEVSLLSKRKSVSFMFIVLSFILVGIGVLLFFMFQIPERVFYPQVNFDGETIRSINYFITQFKVFPRYFLLMLFPFSQNIDHDIPIANTFGDSGVMGGVIFFAVSLLIALFAYKRYKLIFVGILWIYISMAVESSFIPLADVMNEHRLYIPLFGFLLILVQLADMYLQKDENIRRLVIVCLILCGIYSIKTLLRNTVWQSEYSLWADAAKKSPNKARAQFKFGIEAFDNKQPDIALQAFNKTIKLYPKFPAVYSYLGAINAQSGNYQQAIDYYGKYIDLTHRRSKPEGYLSRARLYRAINKMDSAKQDYKSYLSLVPTDNVAFGEAIGLYNLLGQSDSTEVLFKIIAKADRNNYKPTMKMAVDNFNKKNYKQALSYLNVLVDNDSIPADTKSEIFNLRGTVFFYLNDKISSSIDFENATSLNPKNLIAWRNKAMIHRELGEYELEKEAIDNMEQLVPGETQLLILKGRNYYHLHRYDEAKKHLNDLIKIEPHNKEAKELLKKINSK